MIQNGGRQKQEVARHALSDRDIVFFPYPENLQWRRSLVKNGSAFRQARMVQQGDDDALRDVRPRTETVRTKVNPGCLNRSRKTYRPPTCDVAPLRRAGARRAYSP